MKKLLTGCLIGAVSLLLGACGPQPDAAPAPKPKQTLTLGILPDVDSIPFIIAEEKGFFQAQGLTVRLLPFKSALERDSALQSGHLDGAVSDILAAAFAKEGGIDIKVAALTSGSYKLVVHKSSAAAAISDLRGKEIGISKNTIIEYVTDKMLAEAGLDDNSIRKLIIPQMPARLEMLKNGKITAATLPEPLATIAVNNGARILNSSDKLGINPGVLLFTASAANGKKAEIQAMFRAYNQAADYLSKQPQSDYINLLIAKGGFPPAVKGAISLPRYTKAAAPPAGEIDAVTGWLHAKQLIRQAYSYQDLVDPALTADDQH
ncbi:MAG: MetQ/NlpA family ABC transporter substrate-binding protein [Sporomusaceae bacterium]|nr:MetQ/NlpA family ABC transporter substrate-binding protein [Sporomusaceae bacterium]